MSVKQFLESIPRMESHYCRSSTSKTYLEPVFNSLTCLYKEYVKHCNERVCASRRVFTEVFESLNIGLFVPKKDQCDICVGFDAGNISADIYNEHQNRKINSREEKNPDKLFCQTNHSVKVLTMDVQAVLLSPKNECKRIVL